MKSMKKRFIATALCLMTLSGSLSGIFADSAKYSPLLTASADSTTGSGDENGNKITTTTQLFDDSKYQETSVTNNEAVRSEDPFGAGDGNWKNIITVPEVCSIYTRANRCVALHDVNDGKKNTWDRFTPTVSWDRAVAATGIDIGSGKKDTVATISFDITNADLQLIDPTNGGAKVGEDFQITERCYSTLDGTEYYKKTYNTAESGGALPIYGDFNYMKNTYANVNGMFFSIAAGDFNGDGNDSFFAYIPDWDNQTIWEYSYELVDASTYSYTENPADNLSIEYTYSGHIYVPKSINLLSSNVYSDFSLQTSTETDNGKRRRDIPLVDLVAQDIDKDGRDELIVTAGLGGYTNKANSSVTKMCIYDYYNGSFHKTYTLDLQASYLGNGTQRLRYASSAVGDVDVNVNEEGLNFPEIVTGGWIDKNSGTATSAMESQYGVHITKLRTGRVESDGSYTGDYTQSEGESIVNVYGTTTKAINISNGSNLDGTSSQMANGFHRDKWTLKNKLAVGTISSYGEGENSQIILGNTVYEIDGNNKLKAVFMTNYGDLKRYSIQKVITGFYDGEHQGAYFLFADEGNKFHTTYCYRGENSWVQENGYLQETDASQYAASICNVDVDTDGMRIKLDSVTMGWDDVKPLFVLEAPPYFAEADGKVGATSVSKARSEGSSANYSVTAYASFEAGIEAELDLLFTKIAQAEGGGILDASITYSGSKSKERELSITYTNDSGDNAVVVTRAPYYIYKYKVDGSNEPFYMTRYGSPETAGVTVDAYNSYVTTYNASHPNSKMLLINDPNTPSLVLGTPGDPYTYRSSFPGTDSHSYNEMNFATKTITKVDMSNLFYRSKVSSTKEVTYTDSQENGFDIELGRSIYLGATLAGVKTKVTVGGSNSAGYCRFHSDSITRSGTGGNYYSETYPNYEFKWDFGFWDVKATGPHDTKYICVLGYTVDPTTIVSPTVAPTDFKIDSRNKNITKFSWELPEIRGSRKNVASYKMNFTDETGINTKVIAIPASQVTKEGDRYTYSIDTTILNNNTKYYGTLSSITAGNEWKTPPSEKVELTTSHYYTVNVLAGKGLTRQTNGGAESQTTNSNINTIYYSLMTGYEVPADYHGQTQNGISATVNNRNITVSGKPTADTSMTIRSMTPTTYSISYELGGGTLTNPVKTYTIESNTITLPTPVRAGYEFTGWKDSNGNTVTQILKGSTGNKTFTANWKASENTAYTVEYYLQGLDEEYPDTPNETQVLYGKTGDTVSVTPKTIVGFTKPSKKDITIKADGTSVVKFEYARKSFTLTIDKDTGIKTAGSPSNGNYFYGAQLTLKAAAQDGYRFDGWSTDDETIFTKDAVTTITMPAMNITYYAKGEALPDSYEKHEAAAATCETDGNIDYYLGSNGKLYKDTTGTPFEDLNNDGVVDIKDVTIPAIGHKYGEPVWTWAEDNTTATAKFTCANDAAHVKELTDENVSLVTVEPGYNAEGKNTYTAKVTFEGKEYTTTKEVTIPKLDWTGHFEANGNTYTIYDAEGWDIFCDCLKYEDIYNGFSGKKVVLNDNIATSTMAGRNNDNNVHAFSGAFDGNGKKLTFTYTAEDNYVAPFAYISGTETARASISNLKVDTTITSNDNRHIAGLVALHTGNLDITDCSANVDLTSTIGENNPVDLYPAGLVSQSAGPLTVIGCTVTGDIKTDGKYAGGLVGVTQNTARIENCLSSVNIISSTDGDGTHGGIVAVGYKAGLQIEGCTFNGQLLSPNGKTIRCGGFVGWRNSGAEIHNSIFAPSKVTIGDSNSATFARNKIDTYNSYFTYLFNDNTENIPYLADGSVTPKKYNNGQQAYCINAGENVTVALSGEATEYDVSGITVYADNCGLKYGDKIYAGKDENVKLTLKNTPPAWYSVFTSYSADKGTLADDTLTMPEDDVTISAVFEEDYSLVNLSTVSSEAITIGDTLTVKGAAQGGTAPYTYSYYYRKSSANNWNTKLADTTKTTTSFKPGAAVPYDVKVVVKDSKGNTEEKILTVEVQAQPLVNNSTAPETITMGEAITITGAAEGGTAPYTYSYYYKKSSVNNWNKKLENSTKTTTSFTPGAAVPYDVKVVVKDSKGNTEEKILTVNVQTPALVNNSTAPEAIVLGETVTITGAAEGGTAPYTYSYYYKKSSVNNWNKKLENSTKTTTSFTPGAAVPYDVKVVVKDSKGNTEEKILTVEVQAQPLVNNSTAPETITMGEAITITGAAEGGTAPYTYSYYYKKSSVNNWNKKLEDSEKTSTSFKPGAAVPYDVKIVVKDSKNNTQEKILTVDVQPLPLVNNSTVPESITLGDSVIITGAAEGGIAPYTYSYYYKKSSVNNWNKKLEDSEKTSTSFKPGAAVPYEVKVVIKDSKGNTEEKIFTVDVQPKPLVNKSTAPESIVLGESITITGAAEGGMAPYTYSYYYKKSSSENWNKKLEDTDKTSTSFKPGAAVPYDVKVVVKDNVGNTEEQIFTIEVTN